MIVSDQSSGVSLDGLPLAELAALIGSRSTSATIVEAGQNNRVLDFGDRIVRVPRHAGAEAALRREAGLLGRLRPALPIAIPDVRVIESGIGAIAVHDRLPGEPFHSLDGFGEADRERLALALAIFLRSLHGLPAEVVGDGRREDTWQELASRLPADVLPRLSPTTRSAVDAAFRRFAGRAGDLPVAVIHGDFGTGNILADRSRVTGIIDFAGCGLGDPAYDLASLAAGLGDEVLRRLQPHYPGLPAMAGRIAFYRATFPLLDILFGLDHRNEGALADGVAGAERYFATA
ncbi:phosphotransferase family protein [Inquilinus sp. Marseille-Q2685]|uniref:phosphotransferase family protein n=1 Tax=Inquilinus sp. Marseille-Q2685 TaxID=2866581 RepID=UPI001CE45E2D|nr:aminoglycoside phosphotransferase family protein [Inquilinus sp. Marseille-Q2685]